MRKIKKFVVIGGGTGIYSVLSGLKNYPVEIKAIVSMVDDGGSTGILREEFGILPPGDIRKALVALSLNEKILCSLFNYRFEGGTLKGHNFGNIFITALCKIFNNNLEKAIEAVSQILNVKGKVIPVSLEKSRLCARLENGKLIIGETNIDIPKHDGNLKIEKTFLKPSCKINPKARKAILDANFIVMGPGDLYTSIIPNFLVRGVSEIIKKSKARKIYICNLMTKFGETNKFKAIDFVNEIERYLGAGILDIVIINNRKPPSKILEKYRKKRSFFVEYKIEDFRNKKFEIVLENLIKYDKSLIRHNPLKIAKIIESLKGN